MPVQALFLADTHLGIDLPTNPRVRRRRRGHDFLANYLKALEPALAGEVDLVVHGGDVFHRARVPPTLVYQAFEPLKRIGEAGIPVFVVPGNHERSRIPEVRFATHRNVHIFDVPRSVRVDVRGLRVAVSGFPYQRRDVRSRFRQLFEATAASGHDADVSLLCVHHCFEGGTCGPADFMFRNAPDVVRGRDVPGSVAAVLTGHIHRHQVLTTDPAGRPLAAPVFYPGSVERTAFAEAGEPKGYLLMNLDGDGERPGGRVVSWTFEGLPARPMICCELDADGLGPEALERVVRRAVGDVPTDAILRIRLRGTVDEGARSVLAAQRLRAFMPHDMNLDIVLVDEPHRQRGGRGRRSRDGRATVRSGSSTDTRAPEQHALALHGRQT